LLGLLYQQPRHGYDLHGLFDELLAGTWPLKIAQVYTALSAMERDGLVECEVVPQPDYPDRKVYSLTEVGEKELIRWLEDTGTRTVQLREDVVLKVLVGSWIDPRSAVQVIAEQRDACLDALAELLRARDEPGTALSTQLLLEAAVLRLEGDVKWLELCEQRLVRQRRRR
jgi:DNA-binding PadR family transcriptional regulator